MVTTYYPLVENNPNFTIPLVLSEVEYYFNFKWNTREVAWYLTIRNTSGVSLVSNIKLVPVIDLLGNYLDTSLPSGRLVIVPNNYPKIPAITYDNLTTDFLFTYTEV